MLLSQYQNQNSIGFRAALSALFISCAGCHSELSRPENGTDEVAATDVASQVGETDVLELSRHPLLHVGGGDKSPSFAEWSCPPSSAFEVDVGEWSVTEGRPTIGPSDWKLMLQSESGAMVTVQWTSRPEKPVSESREAIQPMSVLVSVRARGGAGKRVARCEISGDPFGSWVLRYRMGCLELFSHQTRSKTPRILTDLSGDPSPVVKFRIQPPSGRVPSKLTLRRLDGPLNPGSSALVGVGQIERWVQAAQQALKESRFSDAARLAGEATRLAQQQSPPWIPRILSCEIVHADAEYSLGNHDAAMEVIQSVLAKQQTLLGQGHPLQAATLCRQTRCEVAWGSLDAAEHSLRGAFECCEDVQNPPLALLASATEELASSYEKGGRFRLALELQNRLLERMIEEHGERDIVVLQIHRKVASLLRLLRQPEQVEEICQRAVRAARGVVAEHGSGPLAAALDDLGMALRELGRHGEVERYLTDALILREQMHGPDHVEVAESLSHLADLRYGQNDVEQAVALADRALGIREKQLGADHLDTAQSLFQRGLMFVSGGDLVAAERMMRRSLTIRETALGKTHPDTASSLNGLGAIHVKQGDYREAIRYFQRAVEIEDSLAPEGYPVTPGFLTNLAVAHEQLGDFDKASELLTRSLSLCEQRLGPDHPETITCLNNLGHLSIWKGDYKSAVATLERTVLLSLRVHGPFHPMTPTSLHNQGLAFLKMGDSASAEPVLAKAFEIMSVTRGDLHPDTTICRTNLALSRFRQGNIEDARKLLDLSLMQQRLFLWETAAIQSERQQLLMTQAARTHLDIWLSITAGRHDAFEDWLPLLSWKGMITQRQRRLRYALSGSPDWGEHNRVARRLSELLQAPPALVDADDSDRQARNPLTDWRRSVDALHEELEVIERRLASQLSGPANVPLDPRDLRDQVVTVLKEQPDPVGLVDLFVYSHDAGPFQPSEERVVAYVIHPRSGVRRIDLGPYHTIVNTWKAWRSELLARKVGDELRGAEMRKLLWSPLEKALGGTKIVALSADRRLAEIPWVALPSEDGRGYLLEDVRIVLIPSPQQLPDLLDTAPEAPSTDAVLLVGGVNYDAFPGATEKVEVSRSRDLGSSPSVEKNELPYLPGTLREVEAIARLAERRSVVLLSGHEASERAIRQNAPNAQWIHLATHGHVRMDSEGAGHMTSFENRATFAADVFQSNLPSALTSGIACSGANRRSGEGREDGVLTGLEVSSLNLTQTDTVVLSACETGLGDLTSGEGLLGLQRSFHIAGARTVVASLWQVSDEATEVLMREFYANRWKRGLSKLESLTRAQIAVLNTYDPAASTAERGTIKPLMPSTSTTRTRPTRSQPHYWAGFVLSGDWR